MLHRVVIGGGRFSVCVALGLLAAACQPGANAGPDQAVAIGMEVQLDATQSVDPNGFSLAYLWTILEAPPESAAALSNPESATPTFVADKGGEYRLQLLTSNGLVPSNPDTMTVFAGDESVPILDAIPDQTVAVGCEARLTLSAIDGETEGDALTYEFDPGPPPAGMTLDAATGLVTFAPTAEQAGRTFTAVVRVYDGILAASRPIRFDVLPEGAGCVSVVDPAEGEVVLERTLSVLVRVTDLGASASGVVEVENPEIYSGSKAFDVTANGDYPVALDEPLETDGDYVIRVSVPGVGTAYGRFAFDSSASRITVTFDEASQGLSFAEPGIATLSGVIENPHLVSAATMTIQASPFDPPTVIDPLSFDPETGAFSEDVDVTYLGQTLVTVAATRDEGPAPVIAKTGEPETVESEEMIDHAQPLTLDFVWDEAALEWTQELRNQTEQDFVGAVGVRRPLPPDGDGASVYFTGFDVTIPGGEAIVLRGAQLIAERAKYDMRAIGAFGGGSSQTLDWREDLRKWEEHWSPLQGTYDIAFVENGGGCVGPPLQRTCAATFPGDLGTWRVTWDGTQIAQDTFDPQTGQQSIPSCRTGADRTRIEIQKDHVEVHVCYHEVAGTGLGRAWLALADLGVREAEGDAAHSDALGVSKAEESAWSRIEWTGLAAAGDVPLDAATIRTKTLETEQQVFSFLPSGPPPAPGLLSAPTTVSLDVSPKDRLEFYDPPPAEDDVQYLGTRARVSTGAVIEGDGRETNTAMMEAGRLRLERPAVEIVSVECTQQQGSGSGQPCTPENPFAGTFVSTDELSFTAQVTNAEGVDAIEWEAKGVDDKNIRPVADLVGVGSTFEFTPSFFKPKLRDTKRAEKGKPIRYAVAATVPVREAAVTDWLTIRQDNIDVLRQEYIDFKAPTRPLATPARELVKPVVPNLDLPSTVGGSLTTGPYDKYIDGIDKARAATFGIPDTVPELATLAQENYRTSMVNDEAVTDKSGSFTLHATSGYRNPAWNKLKNGVPRSIHIRGGAIDITWKRTDTGLPFPGDTSPPTFSPAQKWLYLRQALVDAGSCNAPADLLCVRGTGPFKTMCEHYASCVPCDCDETPGSAYSPAKEDTRYCERDNPGTTRSQCDCITHVHAELPDIFEPTRSCR